MQAQTSTENLFSTYNDAVAAEIVQLSKPKRLSSGTYRSIITGNEVSTSKAGSPMFVTTLKLLRDENDPTSTLSRDFKMWTVVPGDNIKEESRAGLWQKTLAFIQALGFDDVPAPPHFENGQLVFNGDAIDAASRDAFSKLAVDAGIVKTHQLLNNPSLLAATVGQFTYAEFKANYDEAGNLIMKNGYKDEGIKGISATLGKGRTVIAPDAVWIK